MRTTTLTFAQGQLSQAQALASHLPGLTPAPSTRTPAGAVTLTIGADMPAVTG